MAGILRALEQSSLRLTCSEGVDPEGSGGVLRVFELLRLHPGRPLVARASLSRSLRRLHRAGDIELFNLDGWALSDKQALAALTLAEAERDPEGAFANAVAAAQSPAYVGGFFYTTAAEYLDDLRREARARVRHQPMHYIQITPAGRQRLISSRREINRKSTPLDLFDRSTSAKSETGTDVGNEKAVA